MRFGGLQLAANRSTAQFLTKNVAIAPSPTAPFSNNQQPTTMTTIRPIDEELTRLHHPVITEGDDMDAYDALEGFSVASSGSVMIPSGAFSKPHLYRQSSISSYAGNSSYGSMGSYPASYVYDGQHQAMMYRYAPPLQSLPRPLPRYSSSLPNSFPSSLPKSYTHQQYHQQHMHVRQVVYPSYEYPSRYPQQGMNGW